MSRIIRQINTLFFTCRSIDSNFQAKHLLILAGKLSTVSSLNKNQLEYTKTTKSLPLKIQVKQYNFFTELQSFVLEHHTKLEVQKSQKK